MLLVAPVTFFVATTGSDSNPGTALFPFATIQRGVNEVCATISSFGAFSAKVKVADGSYDGGALAFNLPAGGDPTLECGLFIEGNRDHPENVMVSGAGGSHAFVASFNTKFSIAGFKIVGPGVYASAGGGIWIDGPMEWGDAGTQYHMHANMVGWIVGAPAWMRITGGANVHEFTSSKGVIEILSCAYDIPTPVQFTAAFAFGYDGTVYTNGCTYSGSIIGSPYTAQLNGVVNTNGSNKLPTGTTSGSTVTGGQHV